MIVADNSSFFETKSLAVPEAFDGVFSHFYYAANRTGSPIRKTLVPFFQTILVFNLGHKISLFIENNPAFDAPNSLILGPIKKSIEYTLFPGAEMLVVNFKWDAFYRFFGKSLKLYKDFIIVPDDLVKEACFSELWLQLKNTKTLIDKVNLVLDFSLPYLKERETASSQIIDQSGTINNINTVKQIAAQSGYSQRTIQLNYQKYLGFSDKEISRFQRFKNAIELLSTFNGNSETIDWLEIVTQFGYYDQSHLIHDFNYFIGISPTHYLKLQSDMCMATL